MPQSLTGCSFYTKIPRSAYYSKISSPRKCTPPPQKKPHKNKHEDIAMEPEVIAMIQEEFYLFSDCMELNDYNNT